MNSLNKKLHSILKYLANFPYGLYHKDRKLKEVDRDSLNTKLHSTLKYLANFPYSLRLYLDEYDDITIKRYGFTDKPVEITVDIETRRELYTLDYLSRYGFQDIRQVRFDIEKVLWKIKDEITEEEKQMLSSFYRKWALAPYISRYSNEVHWEGDGYGYSPGYSLIVDRYAHKYKDRIFSISSDTKHHHTSINVREHRDESPSVRLRKVREGLYRTVLDPEGELENLLSRTCCYCGAPKEKGYYGVVEDDCSPDTACKIHKVRGDYEIMPMMLEYLSEAMQGEYGESIPIFAFQKVRLINHRDIVSYHYIIDCLDYKIVYGKEPAEGEYLYAGLRSPFIDTGREKDIYQFDICIHKRESSHPCRYLYPVWLYKAEDGFDSRCWDNLGQGGYDLRQEPSLLKNLELLDSCDSIKAAIMNPHELRFINTTKD